MWPLEKWKVNGALNNISKNGVWKRGLEPFCQKRLYREGNRSIERMLLLRWISSKELCAGILARHARRALAREYADIRVCEARGKVFVILLRVHEHAYRVMHPGYFRFYNKLAGSLAFRRLPSPPTADGRHTECPRPLVLTFQSEFIKSKLWTHLVPRKILIWPDRITCNYHQPGC